VSTLRLTRFGWIAPATFALALMAPTARAQAPAVQPAPLPEPNPFAAPTAPAVASPAPTPPDPTPPATSAERAVAASKAETEANANADADAAAAVAAADASTTTRAGSDAADQFKLNLYGFADFSYSNTYGTFAFQPPHSTFAVGRLNLYAGAELGDNWRSLFEVRFMYLPDGTTPAGSGSTGRTDTTVNDYTEHIRPVKWGGISIQRAWLEHSFHPAFTVRVGSWLTPYGIWNVDHGSPTIIGVYRPYIIGEALFPERQTGIETYGTFNFGPSQLGYHLTLSNGRGPIDEFQDLDGNKAVGARLFFKHDAGIGTLTVGASGYRGRYTDSQDGFAVTPTGFKVTHTETARYEEMSLAVDAKWEMGGLLVQSEAILNDTAYDNKLRPTVAAYDGGPPGYMPDHRRYGMYGLVGYRTTFVGVMPYVQAEYFNQGAFANTEPVSAVLAGLNVRPTARVVLKAQYTHVMFTVVTPGQNAGTLENIDLQAAWSF